jgi:sulfane dehydrogenase subunit SoxC
MKLSRRVFFGAAAGIATFCRAAFTQSAQSVQDPTKVPGAPPSALGRRSPFEQPQRAPVGIVSRTPLQNLNGTITPADLHYERHHAGVPQIDPAQYTLLIHGMVDRPIALTLADLKRFPSVSRICFLECSGNLQRTLTPTSTAQQIAGLTSQSEWTGLALSTVLREVGLRPRATWLLAEGGDAALMSRSIPVEKALDDAMIAYAQNGEAIRPEQGYPARLLLPGWEGNTSVKWLRRIELSDGPFMTREETSKYTDPLANGTARMFSFVMDARSIITSPSYPARVSRGSNEITGIAWSGYGRIRRVEVSTNAGRSWSPARLQAPVLSKAHTRFHFQWNWTGAEAVIMSRAVDETGYVQPSRAQLFADRGAGSIPYHLNPVTGWVVREDGTVACYQEA